MHMYMKLNVLGFIFNLFIGSSSLVWQTSTLSITHTDNPNKIGLSEIQNVNPNVCYLTPQSDFKNSTQPFSNMSISTNISAGFSSMKKGISNFVTSFDSAVKPSPDDMSDTMSIRSDASSDSERYVMVPLGDEKHNETVDHMFFVREFCYENKGTVEIASEVLEEESSITSVSDHSFTSSCRRKDLVSINFLRKYL